MTGEPRDMPGTPAGGYTPAQRARVRDAFDRAFTNARAAGAVPKRHRADVTADRLADDVIKWGDLFDGSEADAVATAIQVLREIADGTRTGCR